MNHSEWVDYTPEEASGFRHQASGSRLYDSALIARLVLFKIDKSDRALKPDA
jgi:hypothetical protein